MGGRRNVTSITSVGNGDLDAPVKAFVITPGYVTITVDQSGQVT